MKSLITRNAHVKYESPICIGLKVISKVKVFVHAHADADADANADTGGMTIALRTFVPAS